MFRSALSKLGRRHSRRDAGSTTHRATGKAGDGEGRPAQNTARVAYQRKGSRPSPTVDDTVDIVVSEQYGGELHLFLSPDDIQRLHSIVDNPSTVVDARAWEILRRIQRKREMSGSDRRAGAGNRDPNPGGSTGPAGGSPYQNAPAVNPFSAGASNYPVIPLPFQPAVSPSNVVRKPGTMPREIPTTYQMDPVVAWKEATLVYRNGSVELHSNYLRSRGIITQDIRLTNKGQRAECIRGSDHQGGLIPRVDCTCGWYGLKTLPVDWKGVWIEVEFYGRVIEATLGYRAEWQRVVALLIPKGWCQGGFLCDNEPEMLQFNSENAGFICVCKEHANKKWSATTAKVEHRLGVPVRLVHVDRPD